MSRHVELLKESLVAIERLEAKLRASAAAPHQPLAIVGAGCRFPGGVENLEDLWELVRDGRDAVAEVPRDRWDADAFYDPDPKTPGKMITKRGGFLSQIDRFEPQLFGISPREAAAMDPQQRLLLETAWEALESAAIAQDRLIGSATGVFVGITTGDYGQLLRRDGVENSDVYSATGSALNAAAGRIAFTFGFQGPCVAVDTACSSSLVAVHLACQSLRSGESDLALAGGVNVVLSPDAMILFSKWGMMAPDGACKTFDAAADGFVRAEGCAVIAIKRLSDALAAGDPILAVIRGSAVNSDGRSSGLTVPNGPAQRAVLTKALANATLAPADIDYVEAHGTGTPLGDPIELEALGAVMRGRPAADPVTVASIKTNIGHAEAVSGLAGLLKVVQSLRHGAIAPHLHFDKPNPGIPWASLPLTVPTALKPWPRGARVRRAGVSSFGFSGTNAHVILEEAPVSSAPPRSSDAPALVVLSARTDPALRELAQRTASRLRNDPSITASDVALTTTTGRAALGRRLALLADSAEQLQRDLTAFAGGETPASATYGAVRAGERAKIAFLYTGQGAQYAGMGKALYDSEPVFRAVLDRAEALLAPRLGRSLLEVLFPLDGVATSLGETAFTQPALFALEYGVTELWRSWGIAPSIVLGHSVGEYVAATVAGAMSFEDGLGLIAERGRLMQALPAGGAMAAIFATEAAVTEKIARFAGRVSIAALNGPEEIVISGDADAVSEVLGRASADGVKCRSLEVSHAFHSARLDPMLDAFERRAAEIPTSRPQLTLISNLTGAAFPAGIAPDARYWRRHAREPVKFAGGIDALAHAGVTTLVEVGPQPVLLGLAGRARPSATWAAIASMRRGRDERRELRTGLATLFTRGSSIAWDIVHPRHTGRRISLPTYPFQRERHWMDSKPVLSPASGARNGHPLLGTRHDLASVPGTSVWQTDISLESHPWLRDHRVQGIPIVPATAFIEMALASGREMLEKGTLVVRSIENSKALLLHDGEQRVLQTTLVLAGAGEGIFSVHSRGKGAGWVQHATARLATSAPASIDGRARLEAARAACTTRMDGVTFYRDVAPRGNEWGHTFQGLAEVWFKSGEALGRVQVPAELEDRAAYCFHPAIADACGHVFVAAASLDTAGGVNSSAFVGGGVEELRFHRSPAGKSLWVHALLREPGNDTRVVTGDVRAYDEDGQLVSETLGTRLVRLDETAGKPVALDEWFYRLGWRKERIGEAGERAAALGPWVIFSNRGGLAEAIAAERASRGQRTMIVEAGSAFALDGDRATVRASALEDFHEIVNAVPGVTAVVHLDAPSNEGASPALSELHLVRALAAKTGKPARLWFVTNDAQAVAEGDLVTSPFGGVSWGLGRAVSVEHRALWGGLIDVSAGARADELAGLLLREIEAGTGEDQVAFRGADRYVARLERHRPKEPERGGYRPRSDVTYLVTGGLGGLGRVMSRWLVERGARHLLLVGRTANVHQAGTNGGGNGAAKQDAPALAELEAMGARVQVAALDIAEAGALEACLAERQARSEPPVGGVIHAAGVARARALSTEDRAGLEEGLRAKVVGAWRLHRLFEHEALDCFVLCGSSSGLLRPPPMLGVYAAGNAFLDSLSHHRRARGMIALSVDWGAWGEVGMAAGRSREKQTLLGGMSAMSTADALTALGRLLDGGEVNVAVMPVDWKAFARAYPHFAADPVVASLIGGMGASGERPSQDRGTLAALHEAPAARREELLGIYLREQAARTLGMAASDLDPEASLSSFGFDSLMAVQLKNQLEADLGAVVPMVGFLDGPSLTQLVSSVLSVMSTGAVGADAPAEVWEEGSI